jgi:DNA-binding HxlR family transcriptional regulator
LTFRALQAACDTNPGSLNTRLRELRDLGIVDHTAGGYRLTEHGRSLMTALEPLQNWADDWAATTDS